MSRAEVLARMNGTASGLSAELGVISRAAADRLDTVGVALASRPDHTIADTPHWNRDGDTLPTKGDACTLLRSPHIDPIVLTWSPSA